MKKILLGLLVGALIAPSFAEAGYKSRSSKSRSGYSKTHKKPYSTPFYQKKRTETPENKEQLKKVPEPDQKQLKSANATVAKTSYNPFSPNFWFWAWIFTSTTSGDSAEAEDNGGKDQEKR